MKKSLILTVSVLSLSACASIERLAIPDSQLKNPTLQANGTQEQVNHSAWHNFLQDYTLIDDQGVTRVNYASAIKHDKQPVLKQYIHDLSKIDNTQLSRNAQLAYWTNLYNAKTVDVILDNYPVDSIRNIKDGVFDLGPWDEKRLNVNGKFLSLHDIEHGIVRPLWSDEPNIHYILNCAAADCPNLAQEAYTAANIETKLNEAAYAYVNNPRGVTVLSDGRIVVSKIYSWYLDDFGGSHASILNHIRSYANDQLKQDLDGKRIIDGFAYDWALNDSSAANSLKAASLPKIRGLN